MKQILSLHPPAFGLDISDRSLKIVLLRAARRSLLVESFAEAALLPGVIENGEIKDEKKLAEELKRLVASSRMSARHAVVSLPEEQGFLQVIQLPVMSEEEAESAVRFEAENYIPYSLETVYLDYDILSTDKQSGHLDVLLAAHPRAIADTYLSVLDAAGIIPVALEIESLSTSRAVVASSERRPVLVVDFGESHTGLSAYARGAVRFAASIPVSGRGLTDAVALALQVKPDEAEKLKRKYGLGSREGTKPLAVFQALVPPLTDLAEQVQRYVSFYDSHEFHQHLPGNEKKIYRVLLCGGGAVLPGLLSFFSGKVGGAAVELGNPWVNILPDDPKEIPPLPFEDSLRFSTALGLALRGVYPNGESYD